MPKQKKTRENTKNSISLHGVKQNNLQNITLDIPLGKITVVTGPSGSGKSSLAFQTVYAEGQRRYMETFSPYTRQFFERMDKPKVEHLEGLLPAIALEQSNRVKTTRSTVGTITEINDYLKLFFSRCAKAYCAQCNVEIKPETAQSIREHLLQHYKDEEILVTFCLAAPIKKKQKAFFDFLKQQGFLRLWIDRNIYRVDELTALPRKISSLHIIQDRLRVSVKQKRRLLEAIESALHFGKQRIEIFSLQDDKRTSYTTDWRCAQCELAIKPPSPGLFSFNHPLGACPDCRGFGKTIEANLEGALPHKDLSIAEGVVKIFQSEAGRECQHDLERLAKKRNISTTKPFSQLSKKDQDWILYGEKGLGIKAWQQKNGMG